MDGKPPSLVARGMKIDVACISQTRRRDNREKRAPSLHCTARLVDCVAEINGDDEVAGAERKCICSLADTVQLALQLGLR